MILSGRLTHEEWHPPHPHCKADLDHDHLSLNQSQILRIQVVFHSIISFKDIMII